MFGALDPAKILMILVVALIVLGPERLPKVARQMGSYWRSLVQMRIRLEQEFRDAIPDLDLPPIPKNPRAAVSGFITGLISADPVREPGSDNDAETVDRPEIGEASDGAEMARMTEAWRAAGGDSEGPAGGDDADVHAERPPARQYAAFVDDPSMN